MTDTALPDFQIGTSNPSDYGADDVVVALSAEHVTDDERAFVADQERVENGGKGRVSIIRLVDPEYDKPVIPKDGTDGYTRVVISSAEMDAEAAAKAAVTAQG